MEDGHQQFTIDYGTCEYASLESTKIEKSKEGKLSCHENNFREIFDFINERGKIDWGADNKRVGSGVNVWLYEMELSKSPNLNCVNICIYNFLN